MRIARLSHEWSRAVAYTASLAALCALLGYLTSKGSATPLIALACIGALVVWVAPRPAMVILVLAGIVLVPSPALAATKFHGVSIETGLGIITTVGVVYLWRARSQMVLSRSAVAALGVLLLAGLVQIGLSEYAGTRAVYQMALFWVPGLLLGTMLAGNRQMLDCVRWLAAAIAVFAIIEFLLGSPNLWGSVIGAQAFEHVAIHGAAHRATGTFGHPLVAGTVLIVLAFLTLSRDRRGTVLFALIVAGALVTGSRSAFVGLGAGLIALVLSTSYRPSQKLSLVLVTAGVGWLMIATIPSLGSTFSARVLNANSQEQTIRLNSLKTLETSFREADPTLITGRGLRGSDTYLERTGGNLGFGVYDNQYVTSIYDSGAIVFGLMVLLVGIAVTRARRGWPAIAPLLVISSALFFFEGLYWPITGLLFWLAVGFASSRHRRGSELPRAQEL